jgi:N,N'-diacetyllegionaminate synthase
MSTAFDVPNLQALVGLGMRRIKIASGEISNLPLLHYAAQCRLPIILSTGMCALEDVKEVVEKLMCFDVELGDLAILQCTTNYPASPDQMNLLAIRTLAEEFNVCVGLSDHSQGPEAALAAVALGATVIEKHITLDRTMDGPDHICSMEANEFLGLINAIRVVERSLGDGKKKVLECERGHRQTVRKSIVALRDIKKGEVFSEENITTKRPGTGLSPMHWFDVIGRASHREYLADDFIECPEKSV